MCLSNFICFVTGNTIQPTSASLCVDGGWRVGSTARHVGTEPRV